MFLPEHVDFTRDNASSTARDYTLVEISRDCAGDQLDHEFPKRVIFFCYKQP